MRIEIVPTNEKDGVFVNVRNPEGELKVMFQPTGNHFYVLDPETRILASGDIEEEESK